jgi:hypothetical protein
MAIGTGLGPHQPHILLGPPPRSRPHDLFDFAKAAIIQCRLVALRGTPAAPVFIVTPTTREENEREDEADHKEKAS